ncbi:TPM domain-containing protein [Ignavibacterium sp.]|jgi:uncharacterized membrane protein|uniref:TPM domain-containing protein n=1 Tax=Ignavibacterium sp. TaxID=2651167 RepID=UPI0025B96D99|nr:TPM domain-containing protein [Ignavibacterium sp.]
MSKRIIYDYLSDDELLRISNKIKEAEKKTRAEILVTIKEKRNLLEIRKPIRQLAEIEFQRSGITKTKDRAGVLIFILLSDKQFYILADSAISNIISQKTFDDIAEKMSDTFRKGNFLSGIINCISSLSEILGRYFPVLPDDVNEISNRVRFS